MTALSASKDERSFQATGGRTPIVVMGITGCGKSTLAKAIAADIGWDFVEGDSLHSRENIRKMSEGIPLNDEDRWPWLACVARMLNSEKGLVITCSALRRSYRDFLRAQAAGPILLVFPDVPRETILCRLGARQSHFMPASLVESQFETLERPLADERVLELDGEAAPSHLVQLVIEELIARSRK